MSGKPNRPPKGEPWVWLSRELLTSAAWRTMSGKARKVVDFLLIEHMGKGGRHNGKLKATYRQLAEFGIGSHRVRAAIEECEQLGLIDPQRGGMRVATTYALTWLPLHDGTLANNRWREFKAENQKSAFKTAGRPAFKTAGRSGESAYQTAGRSAPKSAFKTACAYKKDSYQGGTDNKDLSVAPERAPLRDADGREWTAGQRGHWPFGFTPAANIRTRTGTH